MGSGTRLPRDWTPPVARGQSGLFTVAQALEAGATADTVRSRRRSGRWVRVAGDAFALAGAPVPVDARIQAVGLTWPDGVVCLAAAALAHGLPVREPDDIDVIVARRTPSRHGLRTHLLPLSETDVTRVGLTRLTGLDRTIADCLGRLGPEDAQGVLAWTMTRGLLDPSELDRAIRERPGSWGNVPRRRALGMARLGAASVAELRLHDLLRRGDLSGWMPNAPIRDVTGRTIARADALFAAERVVIEVDGRAYHGAERFQADRDRDNALVAAGYLVLRFTWLDLTKHPARTLARIRAALRRSRA
ncbi:MAG: endonuclease domain-containing protein [Actinomycetales bacterium]|nr:endonuclease domain-containing protein [Actinomycetales bacterium]